MPSLTDINNHFQVVIDQFHKSIYEYWWRTNPYASVVKKMTYDVREGRTPKVITTRHELPTAYPFAAALTNIALNDGTGNLDLATTTINPGQRVRTFGLQGVAFDTPAIQLTDLQFEHDAVQQTRNFYRGLQDYATVWMGDWYRAKGLSHIDEKYSTTSADGLALSTNSGDGVAAFTPLFAANQPTVTLNWDHLDFLYDTLNSRGAMQFAVGQAEGEPIYALHAGSEIIRRLFRNDEQLHVDVQYADPKSNFKSRGISRAVRGFVPNLDLYPPRLKINAGNTAFEFIYPTINQAVDTANGGKGQEAVPNPAYKPVSKGGEAVFEVAYIYTTSIYECHVRPPANVPPTMRFDPQNYSMDIRWINNRDNVANKLGDKGYYYMEGWQAAKPIYPEMGAVILFKIE